jgi:hypothetical protein
MRPEVERAVRALGGGPLPPSFHFAPSTLQAVGQLCQPMGDMARGQSEPGSVRSPEGRPFFGAASAVQP